jgi:hypothetical protein
MVGLGVIVLFLLWPYFTQVPLPHVDMSTFGAGTIRARVLQIIEDGEIDLGGTVQRYQIARVELLAGKLPGHCHGDGLRQATDPFECGLSSNG